MSEPYWTDGTTTIYHGLAQDITPSLTGLIVTDPPFNIGYGYRLRGDNRHPAVYRRLLADTLRLPCVVVHYPEQMFLVADVLAVAPNRCVSWVYPSNTRRQHRQIAYFEVKPDFRLIRQPYRNPTDKRIRALIASGSAGAALYDWWDVDQVKNVSSDKIDWPCQMPVEIMRRTIGIIPGNDRIIDPFMGGGTTLVAAVMLGRQSVGIDSDERACEIAACRLEALGKVDGHRSA